MPRFVPLFLLTFFFLGGCASVPEDTRPAKVALLSNPPKEIIANVDLSLRKKLAFVDAPEINTYLTNIAGRLFGPTSQPISVSLVSSTTAGYRPSIWVVPGGKIFVDIRVLRALHFENELASGMVVSWELSEDMDFRERLVQEGGKSAPDPVRVWSSTEIEYQRAIESSVDRIYKAGYDPRGLVTYFDRTAEKEKNDGSTDTSRLNSDAMKEKARRSIAFYAPLLNPIVHTEEFYKMKKRLERL